MIFNYFNVNKTALYAAVEKNNIEICKLLLTNANIDVNIPCVFNYLKFYIILYHYIEFNSIVLYFNTISFHIF